MDRLGVITKMCFGKMCKIDSQYDGNKFACERPRVVCNNISYRTVEVLTQSRLSGRTIRQW